MDRVLEEGHIRVGRIAGAGFGRLRSCIRVPVRLRHGQGTERAGSSLQLLQPKRLPKLRLGRAHAWDQGCGVRRLRLGLEPGHFFGGCSLPPLELGARPGGGLLGLPLGLLPNAVLERTAHPVVDSLRPRAGLRRVSASWGPVIAHEKRSPPTSTAINTTPAFVTMPPGSAPSGGRDPLLPAAHRSASRGVNRQLARLSPICSHPSASTWRAM